MSESQRAARTAPDADPLPARPRLERRDPLGPILALGRRQLRTGTMLGIAGALIVHGAGAAQAASTLFDLAGFASSVRAHVQQRLRAEFDIQVDEPPPPPPEPEPEPPPEPEPEKQPEPPPPVENAPPPEPGSPPPAAAQAANVLTAPADPEEPLDLTGEGFVVGTGDTYSGGITASTGTSKTAVRDVRAAATGVGKVPAAAPVVPNPAPSVDRSRAPKPIGDLGSLCSNMFPAEANAEGINYAVVTVSATIQPDGRAKNISVLRDPGSGFGGAARLCVARGRFEPGLDSAGTAVAKTLTFNIRFTR